SKSLGYSNEELMVMNNRDYMSPDSAKKIYNLFNQIYKTANPIKKMTYEIIRKDGSRGFHELSASLMKDQAGQPIGFRGIAHDITERKLAEELLELRTKQWQNTFDAIKDMIVIVNKDRQIVQINQAARDTFPDLGSQRPCYEIFHGVRVLPEGCVSCNVFETGQPVVSEYYDPRLTKWFDLYAYPIENVGGEVEQSVHVFRDITQQMKEAEEKERLTLRIQRSEKMETMGTLAGGVAHDLNNILGSIVGYPDLLLMDLPEDSKLRKPILAIQQSGQKATAVVQDLLTLARRGVVVNEVVNLNEIITEYLKSPEFDGLKTYYTDIQIQTNLKADLLNILGSPVHLSKTVMNLVSNAAEAITGKGTVKISSDHRYIDTPIRGYDKIEEGDYVVLEVTDDGMGISSEHIDKIFEPFYTKKKMGRSGTGLGMAVVWGTVKDHKGYIDVQSTEGKGTVFSLYFPVTRKEVMERITTGSIEDYLGNGESILVVDDVEEQRELASGMLEKLGYSVSTVSSGEEAVEYLKNNKTDLIVLDMIMDPGIDGFETYKRILEMYPGQKAIIATGFSETERVKEAQRLGAGAYIKKPFLLEKLGIAIKEELKK
ncbi:MAG: response regulator, partial [Bacteroidetes bacterium]|nr:response regulator [Bacteroidota bacterium]